MKAEGRASQLSSFRLHPSSFDIGLGLFALLLYSLTLAPGLLPADSGEYQLTGATLGVAHPPGYALYTIVSWLISRVPGISPGVSINFLSAVFAALTLVCINRAVRRWTGSLWAGLGAALALAFSTTFWAQATTANVRMLTALAIAWALERLAAASPPPPSPEREGQRSGEGAPDRVGARLIAFALGLGVSHHGSVVFMAVVLGLYALWRRPAVLRRPWPLFVGLLPFLAWLYFPLNALFLGGPKHLATLDGFLEQILARGFSGDMLYFATPAALPGRLFAFSQILPFQWNGGLLSLTALGAVAALWRGRAVGVMLLAAWLVHSFIAITYRAPQTAEYLLPSYVVMAIWIGFAISFLIHAVARRDTQAEHRLPAPRFPRSPAHLLLSVLITTITLTPLALQLAATFPAYRALAQDNSTRGYAEAALREAPSNAVLLSNWHWATPMWYLQQVEGRRPDVEVRYVFPRTVSYAQDWVGEINAVLPIPPVVVTSFFGQEFRSLPYRFAPLGPAWEVRREPLTLPPTNLTGAQSFGDLDFLGFHLEPASVQSVDLTAAWRISGEQRDLNFYVHLLGPDGRLYGQKDVSYPAARYTPDDVLLDRYHLDVRPDAWPGEYTLTAGAYRPDGARVAETTLTTLQLGARQTPPVTAHPLWWPLSGAWLIGYDVDRTLADLPRLYLHWQLGREATTVTVLDAPFALPPGPGYVTTSFDLAPDQPITIGGLTLPMPDASAQYVVFGNQVILIGRSLSAQKLRPGEPVTVEVRFLAARPITQDLTLKVELVWEDGRRAPMEATPIGGALPTLKWITGSRLTDRRTLSVPPDAPPGPARIVLGWYDAFTEQDLAILDPRLAPLGQTVTLGSVEIVD